MPPLSTQGLGGENLRGWLSELASARDAQRLAQHVAAWPDQLRVLAHAVRDGMDALVELARSLDIGFLLNAGYRCDVDLRLYQVEACDNYFGRGGHVAFQAATAPGALAGAILSMQQLREDR